MNIASLFGRNKTKKELPVAPAVDQAAAIAAVTAAATTDDYEEWLNYLAHRTPAYRKPGTTIKDEYEQWLVARARGRATAHSKH